MCRGRVFMRKGWSHEKNDRAENLHLYQDAFDKEKSYVNDAAVMREYAAKDGFLFEITKLLAPSVGKHLKYTI